jgi:hypothetical protein
MQFLYKRKALLVILLLALTVAACTKYGKGFLSPYVQYAVNQLSIIRGRTATSYSLITDGSSVPLQIKWTHIYDSAGNIVDTLFSKTYPVAVWTSAYNPLTDTTYAAIMAKQSVENLTPLTVNASNGTIEANAGTLSLPLGNYKMDLKVSNSAGSETLDTIMQIDIVDGKPLETSPEQGNFSNSLAVYHNAAAAKTVFNGVNNPFDLVTVTRLADTPNSLILKVTDRFGTPFNWNTGEITKRPNTGLNPNPPYLQNLQDYAPDTYQVSDTAISIKFPLVPFPIASLGNGFNMYYNILAPYVSIDSTSTWSSNSEPGVYYQGTSDSHYLGVYTAGRYNAYLRIPMRVQVPGAYEIVVKILNLTRQ